LRGSKHKFQARRRAILSHSLRQKKRHSKVGDRRDNSAMSVPASFGGVRCRTNSVGVKWRDDVGVFFWEGVGRRNNKVMGRDTARGPILH